MTRFKLIIKYMLMCRLYSGIVFAEVVSPSSSMFTDAAFVSHRQRGDHVQHVMTSQYIVACRSGNSRCTGALDV